MRREIVESISELVEAGVWVGKGVYHNLQRCILLNTIHKKYTCPEALIEDVTPLIALSLKLILRLKLACTSATGRATS